MQRTSVNIVLLGASGSGKSSLVHCFVNDSACTPHSPPPSIIPPRTKTIVWEGSPAPLTIRITDTGAATPPPVLAAACAAADAFIICFDLGLSGTSEGALSLMESTRARFANAIIMMAGTKRDTVAVGGGLELASITDRMRQLGIEGLMLCQSVTIQRHVTTLFLNTIKFVFHPVRPLLDPLSSSLTPPLTRALTRIFKLSDTDGDQRLSPSELCLYQQRAYGNHLLPQECVGLLEMLLDAGGSSADAGGVTLDGFFYLHKMMVQGGRQESVWATLSSHGHAAPPSLRLLPSSIPQLSPADHARLMSSLAPCATWGPQHTAWRVGGGHRATLTPRALQFIATFFADEHSRCSAELLQQNDVPSQVVPSVFSALLEAGAASHSFPDNEIMSSPATNCSVASAQAAWIAAAALNPQAVIAALCQAGMDCSSSSAALRIHATTHTSADGVTSSDDAALIVVLLLHGGSEADTGSSGVALLDSLNCVGPSIFPPRNAQHAAAVSIRCLPSEPPVCAAYAHVKNAVTAAAALLPDIVILLPGSSTSPSSPSSPSSSPSHSPSSITQLQRALPTVPVVDALHPPADASALCSMLTSDHATSDHGIEWKQVAAASIAAVRSIRTKPPQPAAASSRLHEEARKFCHLTGILAKVIYGGKEAYNQQRYLSWDGCDILVTTPGRLIDFMDRIVDFSHIRYIVLDEADRMLDMGFEPQIRQIMDGAYEKNANENIVVAMFSATFPKEVKSLAEKYLQKYIYIGIGNEGGKTGSVSKTIKQELIDVRHKAKNQELFEQIKNLDGKMLIFCGTKKAVSSVYTYLNSKNLFVAQIHGDLSQKDRESELGLFKNKCSILIATDVASRGLDIPDVAFVINYDLPTNIESYIHRIGRTGRIGKSGTAISFITDFDEPMYNKLYNCFKDSNQEIPQWFGELIHSKYQREERYPQNRSNKPFHHKWRGGGGGGFGGNRNFGNRDYRNNHDDDTGYDSDYSRPQTSGYNKGYGGGGGYSHNFE